MTIQGLFREAGVVPLRIDGTADVSTMTMDSRRVKRGAMFVCMPPATAKSRDSNDFVPAAREAGAASVLTFSDEGFEAARRLGMSVAVLPPELYKDALWKLAKVAFANPSGPMKVIGVTGTNGKTTTAWLIRDMLKVLGMRAAYLGTLGFQLPDEERELQNTTPYAIELNELLAEARDKGVEAIAMEVSSHALAERRVDGIEFDAGVFTNLTQDHLDFHGSMEAYEAAKQRLFTELPAQSAKRFEFAVNVGDPTGAAWMRDKNTGIAFEVQDRASGIPTRHFVQHGRSPIRLFGVAAEVRVDGISLEIGSPDLPARSTGPLEVSLGGSYNVENCLSAAAGMVALGFSLDGVRESLPRVRPVPGRFEAVRNDAGIGILVDYAHTPDALEKLLDTVRDILNSSKLQTRNSKLITVFGCGGDRDRTKRPKMARAATERSDVTVVTSDNPRTEDPRAIVEEVATGVVGKVDWSHVGSPPPSPSGAQSSPQGEEAMAAVIIDRREAIAYAIRTARPGDVVVIAGKGHENYQIIGRTKFPMDDRELAGEALESLGANRL